MPHPLPVACIADHGKSNPWLGAPAWAYEVGYYLNYLRVQVDAIRADIERGRLPPNARIVLDLAAAIVDHQPAPTKEPPMSDTITIKSTDVWKIPLGLVIEGSGASKPIPSGDTFSAVPSSTAISAVIGTMDDGVTPAVIVNALTLPGPGTMDMTVAITDSASDKEDVMTVNYPVPPEVDDIVANVSAAVVDVQPAPTAPAP